MELKGKPKNSDYLNLFYQLSKSIFREQKYKSAIVVVRNPYLVSLMAILGGKISLTPPFHKNTCAYIKNFKKNKNNISKYQHIVINDYIFRPESGFNGFYYVYSSKDNKNLLMEKSHFEEKAIPISHRNAEEWLNKNDITEEKLNKIRPSSKFTEYPILVGKHNALIETLNEILTENFSGLEYNLLLNAKRNNDFEKIFSVSKKKSKSVKGNKIYINSLPSSLEEDNSLIILSNEFYKFIEIVDILKSMYSDERLSYIGKENVDINLINKGILNRGNLVAVLISNNNQ